MKKEKLATCCYLLSPPLSPFSRLFPLFPHFLPVLSPSQSLFSHFSLSSPPQPSVFSSMVGCVLCSSPPWLAVSRALISTLLHRRPSCPPQLVVSSCSDLHSSSTVGSSFLFFPLFIQGVSRAKFITSPPSQSQPSLNLGSQSHHLPNPHQTTSK